MEVLVHIPIVQDTAADGHSTDSLYFSQPSSILNVCSHRVVFDWTEEVWQAAVLMVR